ncbi:MAG: phosphate/phosphite/phosphonate ABC transporter substrate-binding protein [Bacteroidota bacterium]|nr:phosphate/phosphite/phosphonate ABC transporter substrate-binding protein [Bacteroidota bacterium]
MKSIKYLLYLSPIILFIIISSFRDLDEGKLGSRSNPVKIYFTPSLDANKISNNARELVDYLEKETGYYFTTAVPSSYIAIVEAFGTKKADIAAINTFSYIMANEKYGAEARLKVIRPGGETTYKGQFITRFDSGINTIEDLNNKKFAFVDPSSTSGYILPQDIMTNKGIKLSETVFAQKHDNVVTMVYNKQVDAGATFYSPPNPSTGEILDARIRVKQQYPDVEKKIKIFGFTQSIPNDPWVFRKDMDEKMKVKIINAMLKFTKTDKGKKALFEIADIVDLVPAKDKDYDNLRSILSNQKIKSENLIKKK